MTPCCIVNQSLSRLALGLLAWAFAVAALAQAPVLDASLNERVERVPSSRTFPIDLETTFFMPEGSGPFPVVVINHGKAEGDVRFQPRSRPVAAARYFLQRGYAVVAPMRQGFSNSGGRYVGSGCNIEGNGRAQADDVKAVLDHVVRQPWADKDRLLVVGQSHGGWTTLAFGALNYPGVKGLINFAGGLRQEGCAAWERGLAAGAAAYAQETRVPTIWFYGDNDSYFSPTVFRPMHEHYTAAGGQAKLVAYGAFGTDSHALFSALRGGEIWNPEVDKFLASVGLPNMPLAEQARFAPPAPLPAPPPTGFAQLNELDKLPFVRETGRAGYTVFLGKIAPRAFAIAPTGSWGWADGGDDPLKRALDNCNRSGKGACRLYAVDNDVVWKGSD